MATKEKKQDLPDEEIDAFLEAANDLRQDDNLSGALEKLEELISQLSLEQRDRQIEALKEAKEISQKIFEDHKEREQQQDVSEQSEDQVKAQAIERFSLQVKAAQVCDQYIFLKSQVDDALEDDTKDIINEGQVSALAMLLDIKDFRREEKIEMMKELLKNCHEENYAYFLTINYKFAKELCLKSQSMPTDNLANANKAMQTLTQSTKALMRAIKAAERAENNDFQHGKEDKLNQLKEKIDNLNYVFGATLSLLDSKNSIEEAMEDFGDDLQTEEAEQTVVSILDGLQNGLRCANDSQNDLMKAQIYAQLGKVLYKYKYKGEGDQQLGVLKQAKKFYSDMLQLAGTLQSQGRNIDANTMSTQDSDNEQGYDEIVENWFLIAKQEDLDLQGEINELQTHLMGDKEKKARQKAKEKVDEAKAKQAEDKTPNKLNWVTWFNNTYVNESVRQQLPGDEILSNNRKFARWYVKNISASIHPDNFIEDFEKKILYQELAAVSNKIVNMLKGQDS